MPLFDMYWRSIGLPWSRVRGAVSDSIPFSIVEATLWVGTAATILLAFSFLPDRFFGGGRLFVNRHGRVYVKARGMRLSALLAGPVFLIALGLGQGAFPGSLAPTAWRTPLTEKLGVDSLPEESFRAWVAAREEALNSALGDSTDRKGSAHWAAFQGLTETEVLASCDTSLDAVLSALELPAGRTVRSYKNMGPWTATLGLAYGGPAFHDPFFAEIAIVSETDMPAPHFWRLMAACHEAAHAKGFTREMDAEILTQLALAHLTDVRFRTLADIHFLRKAGLKIDWPDSLISESERVRARRAEVERDQPVVRTLRRIARKLGVQNSATKYGARGAHDAWNPHHPFFATVHNAMDKVGEADHGRQ